MPEHIQMQRRTERPEDLDFTRPDRRRIHPDPTLTCAQPKADFIFLSPKRSPIHLYTVLLTNTDPILAFQERYTDIRFQCV
jgi:hypothetical protein